MNIFYFIKKSFNFQFNAFIASTSIPGYKFTNCYANKLQQVFWHLTITLSFVVVLAVSLKFWNQFENQSTLPVYEMLEQGSKLPFPSVYVCMGYPLNPQKLEKYRKYILRSNLTMSFKEIDKNLQFLFRFQRSSKNVTYKLDELFDNNIDIVKLRKHLIKFYYQINELLKDCYVQGLRVDCADIFIPLELAAGYCFVYNSIYTQKNFHHNPRKIAYREFSEFDDDWTIRFQILYNKDTALLMYLKDPLSFLSLTDYPNYVWRPEKQISEYGYTIINQYSEEKNRKLKLSQRKCIFSDEKFPYKELNEEFDVDFYDQNLCYSYCHTKELIKLCNCFPTFALEIFPKMVKTMNICRINNMPCYETNYLHIRRKECKECLRNCNRTTYVSKPEIREGEIEKYNSTLKMEYFEFTIDLVYWPVMRFRILNIFTATELLMATASIFSLLLGTSLISFIEAFYCFFIRLPCSYFFNRGHIEKVIKTQDEIDAKKPLPCINMSLKPGLKKL